MLELSYKDFEAAIIKMLQQTIMNSLKAKKKKKSMSQQINRTYKKEPNGSYKNEKYSNK